MGFRLGAPAPNPAHPGDREAEARSSQRRDEREGRASRDRFEVTHPASRVWRAAPFALWVGARAVVIGGLVVAAGELALRHHLYATALVLLTLAALVAADLARSAQAADRMLTIFADGLAAGAIERPAWPVMAFGRLSAAVDRAADALDVERMARQRRIDTLEALLDTVSAALFVLRPDGSIDMGNRAAQALAGRPTRRLADAPAIGPVLAERLMALGPGARDMLRLGDGRQMLASAAGFALPGGERRRLIALQSVSGELDLVELKAWQDLVRILAHEMMNSLTPIVSLAESVERLLESADGAAPGPDVAAEVASAVQVIGRRSEGLMNFVDRYRRVAELPAPQRATVRLAELASDLDRLIAPMLGARGVDYASEVDPLDLTLGADPELLEQAVLNLLKNAIEAVGEAERPMVRLSCRALAEGVVEIAVADNGRGLPEDWEGLFTPFFTTKAGGSGIGLSIARQVALAHQGQALARRREPEGAVFSLVFPPAA